MTLASLCSTRQLGDLLTPDERGAHTVDLVRRDLLSVARTAQHDAEASRVSRHTGTGGEAERRVVIEGVVLIRAMVDDLVALLSECGHEELLRVEPGVV